MDGLITQWGFDANLGSSDPFPLGAAAAEVVYLIEATVYDPALPGTRVLRYCSGGGYVYGGNYYEPRIKHPGRLKRALFSEGKTSGPGQIGFGEVVLVNTDGALDALTTYGFDGRQLMIKRGFALGAMLSSVVLLAACGMEQATSSWDEVAIRVKDRKVELNVPLQANKYGGTNALPNGVDGTADIQGKPKPLLFGEVKNATPVCVNTSKLIYQLHDGALAAVSGVYDKGIPLTAGAVYASQAEMEATAPLAGQFRAWPAGGMFRLGSTPVAQLTADATEGSTEADCSAAKLAQRLAARAIAAGDIESTDVTALHAINSAIVGYYTNAETTVAAALDEVLGSIGGWYSFDTLGKLRMGRLDAPAGNPVATLTEAELLQIERLPTSDEGRGLPTWRVNLNYDRNWSPAATGWADSQLLGPWRSITRPNSRGCSLAFGNGTFVLLNELTLGGSATNSYQRSTDGINWTSSTFPTSKEWALLGFVDGRFVAMSDSPSPVLITSTDGISWSSNTVIPVGVEAIAGGNGITVVLFGGTSYLTSTDGITWTTRTMPASSWRSLHYGNGLFIATANDSSGTTRVYFTSTDGINWVLRAYPSEMSPPGTLSPGWVTFAFGNGHWVGASNSGSIMRSVDGITWGIVGSLPLATNRVLLFANGRFYSVSIGSVHSSIDASIWAAFPFPLVELNYTPGTPLIPAVGTNKVVVLPVRLITKNVAVLDLEEGSKRAAWLPTRSLTVIASNPAIQTIHPLARELNVDTLIVGPAAAQAEANRLLTLHSADRVRLQVKVPRAQLPADLLGKPVLLQVPRYDYGAGKLLLVIGVEEDCAADTLTLDLWG